jgi:hypothetical protein
VCTGKVLTRKPPTSPRLQNEGKKEDGIKISKRSCESSKPGSRVRSASTGRDKKSGELFRCPISKSVYRYIRVVRINFVSLIYVFKHVCMQFDVVTE